MIFELIINGLQHSVILLDFRKTRDSTWQCSYLVCQLRLVGQAIAGKCRTVILRPFIISLSFQFLSLTCVRLSAVTSSYCGMQLAFMTLAMIASQGYFL